MNSKSSIRSQKLDKIVDEGKEDIIEYLDLSTARRPGLEVNETQTDIKKIPNNYREKMKKLLAEFTANN